MAGQAEAIPLISIDEAKVVLTHATIGQIKTALVGFQIDNGRFPTVAEGLQSLVKKPSAELKNWRPWFDSLPVDSWGHAFVYAAGGDKEDYSITSLGPDGKPGTSDDVK